MKQFSSHIQDFTYDKPSQSLTVVFRNGHRYTHHEVPNHIFDNMKDVFSVGRYYHTVVEKRFKKVTVTKPEIVS